MGAPKGNKFALGLTNSGRPPLFDSPKELLSRITEYFDLIEEPESLEPLTITGLCLFLGFESRQSFYDYEKKEEYTYIIKRARLVIESAYERLLNSKTPTGAIFALKNMGWFDRQEITGKDGEPIITSITTKVIRNGTGN